MCRWLAYSGSPIYLEELIFKPEHSLIDQSLAARVTATTTNADGFGVGWYGNRSTPGLYRDIQPAWNDSNLRDLAAQIESPLFFAHVRSATVPPVQQTNCHPFRHKNWLFMHNGSIREFTKLRRDLLMAVAPGLFPFIQGSTDSELMFYLALTFGLEFDPIAGVEKMVDLVETEARRKGIHNPVEMTLCVSDGERIYAFRYRSQGRPPSLFHSTSLDALEDLHPSYGGFEKGARAVVSEPLDGLTDHWQEIPDSTVAIVEKGTVTTKPFQPQPVAVI
jgi:predicted glutamine amidotransferase